MQSPVIALDHLRISVASFDAELANYRILFEREPLREWQIGGQRAAAFASGNVTLLLIESPTPRGLEGVCFRVDKLDRLRRRLQRVGIAATESPDPFAQAAESSSPIISAAAGDVRGLSLGFVERQAASASQQTSDATLLSGLDHIVIATSDAQATGFLLAAQLGLDMRMDISRPEWDARLLFFRCGDLIVEVFQQLGGDELRDEDSLYGLSWRVRDADRAAAYLMQCGFNVSAVRKGRRPGTRVLTLQDRTAGVATLLIEHSRAQASGGDVA